MADETAVKQRQALNGRTWVDIREEKLAALQPPDPNAAMDEEDISIDTFEDALDEELSRCRAVMIARQRKYGKRNISKHGEVGVAMRFSDKAERINNSYFDENGNPRPQVLDNMGDESLDDTFIDAANYSLIALMLRHGTWENPLEEHRNG